MRGKELVPGGRKEEVLQAIGAAILINEPGSKALIQTSSLVQNINIDDTAQHWVLPQRQASI